MASRYYRYTSTTQYTWLGRRVMTGGTLNTYSMYTYTRGFIHNQTGYALRPIVTLKSGLRYYGTGTEDDPVNIAG